MKKLTYIIILLLTISGCSHYIVTWDKNNWEKEKGNTFYFSGISIKSRAGLMKSHYNIDSEEFIKAATKNYPIDKIIKVIENKYKIVINADEIKKIEKPAIAVSDNTNLENNIEPETENKSTEQKLPEKPFTLELVKKDRATYKKYRKLTKATKNIITGYYWISDDKKIINYDKRIFLNYIIDETVATNRLMNDNNTDPKLLISCVLIFEVNNKIVETLRYTIPQIELSYASEARYKYFQPEDIEEGYELINKELINTPKYLEYTINRYKK